MRNWLELSDLALAQKIDYTEKNGAETDPTLAGFVPVRAQLSMLAWNAFAAPLDCDSGPIARTGVMTFAMEDGIAAALKRDDFAIGYVHDHTQESCDHLNRANGYRALTGETTALLDRTMEGLAPQIEQALGHPFRIVSVRSFELQPRTGIEGRRTARWDPPASGNAIAREGPTIVLEPGCATIGDPWPASVTP